MSARRSWRYRLILIGLALAALLGVSAQSFPGRAFAAPTAGIQLHVLWGGVSADETQRQLDRVAASGAGVARVDVGWASLETLGKGRWSSELLSRMDALVAGANARGIRLLLTLSDTPCWASSAPAELKQSCAGSWWDREVQYYPPSNPRDYADALAFIVGRYGTRVAGYEMWNEPNLNFFFRTSQPVARYAELIRTAYPVAKAANPSVTLVAGALSESDVPFTEALYAAGIKGSFDAFSIHPYSHDRSPLDSYETGGQKVSFVRGVPAVHDAMVRNADPKPLWLTEFGWSTSTVRGPYAWENGVSEATQGQYVGEALRQVRSWSYVPVAIWFNLKDTSADPADRVGNYGLLRRDGSEKPAFAAFRSAAASLASAPAPTTSSTPAPSTGTTAPSTGTTAPSTSTTAPSTGTTAPSATVSPAPGDQTTAPAPAPAPSKTKVRRRTRMAAASLQLTVARRRGRITARGQVASGRRVLLTLTRVRGRRSVLKAWARTDARGRFARTFSGRRLAQGRWKVTALAPAGGAVRPAFV